jgi:hypothetical protein
MQITDSSINKYMFHPDLVIDEQTMGIELKEEKREETVQPIKPILYSGTRYLIYPQKDNATTDSVWDMYPERSPDERRLPGNMYYQAIVMGQIKPIGKYTKTPFGDKSVQIF